MTDGWSDGVRPLAARADSTYTKLCRQRQLYRPTLRNPDNAEYHHMILGLLLPSEFAKIPFSCRKSQYILSKRHRVCFIFLEHWSLYSKLRKRLCQFVIRLRRFYHTLTLQVSVAEWLARLTAVWEDPGSNHAADSCVYRDNCCDIQSWARAVHLYCSA